jgi:IclR family transcriptional regulator, KDG regulon repressor
MSPGGTAPDKPAARGGGIQSLERAFRILEEVARHDDGLGLVEISRTLEIHTSTVHHLCRTLTALGYLRQAESGKRYRIGRGIFALAAACADERELSDAARPYLVELSKHTGESAHFAVWAGEQVLILERAHSTSAFQMNERAGMLRPAHCTAIGKVLLSGLDDVALDKLLEDMDLVGHTPNTITDAGNLRREVERIRREGVAYDDSEYNEEARCIAAPVRDFHGRVVGAIGFSGPVWRVSLGDLSSYSQFTAKVARELSRELGWREGQPSDAPAVSVRSVRAPRGHPRP